MTYIELCKDERVYDRFAKARYGEGTCDLSYTGYKIDLTKPTYVPTLSDLWQWWMGQLDLVPVFVTAGCVVDADPPKDYVGMKILLDWWRNNNNLCKYKTIEHALLTCILEKEKKV